MIEPSWPLVFFALIVGGSLGFWACAAMAVAQKADDDVPPFTGDQF